MTTRPKVLLVFLMRFEQAPAMLQGVVQFERENQLWTTFLDDEARAERDPEFLRGEKWDGIISRHTSPELVQMCRELKIPLVDLNDTPPFPQVPKIRPDNVAIGRLGAEHYLERGFRHFAFCGFAHEPWSVDRRKGFVERLEAAGQTCDVLEVKFPGVITPEWNAAQTRELAAWLQCLPKPAAVMACVDVRAFQILAAAQHAGLLVPEDVALLGVNNDVTRCELSYPPLSSVALNSHGAGFRAAETMDRMLRGGKPAAWDVRVEPKGVVTRLSTEILAVPDKKVAAALNFIRERACKGVSVNHVVKHTEASRSHLEKKFRQFIGRSPQAEIRRVQVAKVKELLTQTDLPLRSIARMTGFTHDEYMSVVFKRLTAESPGHFRKRLQTSTEPRQVAVNTAG